MQAPKHMPCDGTSHMHTGNAGPVAPAQISGAPRPMEALAREGATQPARRPESTNTSERVVDTREVRILVVDDDPDQLAVCRMALQRGFPHGEVVVMRSGQECIHHLSSVGAEAVILDYKMPGMNGIEVLRHIRDSWPDALVILVTGYGDEAVAVEAMKLGAADYVMKSMDYATVLPAVLSRCLDIRDRERELEAERTRNIQLATVIQTTRALAHEINNPLQVISGTCELLSLMLTPTDPALGKQAGDLVTVCDRIADVIRRLYKVTNPVSQMRMGIAMLDIEASSPAPDAPGSALISSWDAPK